MRSEHPYAMHFNFQYNTIIDFDIYNNLNVDKDIDFFSIVISCNFLKLVVVIYLLTNYYKALYIGNNLLPLYYI